MPSASDEIKTLPCLYDESMLDDLHGNTLQKMKAPPLKITCKLPGSKMADYTVTETDSNSHNNAHPIAKTAQQFRRRAVLTAQTAAAIFNLRGVRQTSPASQQSGTPMQAYTGRSVLVARMFGISPKAVRDIWNFRTWRHITDSLRSIATSAVGQVATSCDPIFEFTAAASIARPVGRPRGSKDSHPRRRRATAGVATAVCEPCNYASVQRPTKPCQSSTAPSTVHATGPCWIDQGAMRRCPVGGPPMAACRSLPPPAGAFANAAEDDDDPILRRSYPFFLQDLFC